MGNVRPETLVSIEELVAALQPALPSLSQLEIEVIVEGFMAMIARDRAAELARGVKDPAIEVGPVFGLVAFETRPGAIQICRAL